MLKKLLFITLNFTFFIAQGQFIITPNTNAQQLAQQLAGSGVTISNVTLNCAPVASGQFVNAPAALGINEGIVLSTGRVADISQAPGAFASTNNNTPGDANLNAFLQSLGGTFTTFDACALEFDITVTGNFISFNYAMGSEEYPNFVCDIFNDVFAFFITGPNPAGGNYTNQNIALLPNSNVPVSINTVNGGFGTGFSPFCNLNNTQYFQGQIPGMVFGGNTVTLEANAPTVPCATYRFKLVIADGGDRIYDSGVFLEAGSFTSNTISISSSSTSTGATGSPVAIEGCLNGQFIFELLDAQGDSTVQLLIGGTAINGVDYELIPTTVDFTGGSVVTVNIIPIEDNIAEGPESVIIYLAGACPGEFSDSAILFIDDRPLLNINPVADSLCLGESIEVTASNADTYLWSPTVGISDPTSNVVTLSPDSNTIYTLTYTVGTCTFDTIVDVSVVNILLIDNVVVDESCAGAQDGSISILIDNAITQDINYTWSNGDTTSAISNLEAGLYSVLVEEIGCEFEFFFEVLSTSYFLDVTSLPNFVCVGELVNLFSDSNLPDTTVFTWSPDTYLNNVNSPNTTAKPENTITYYLTADINSNCSVVDSITIQVPQISATAFFTDTVLTPGQSVEIGATIDTADLLFPVEYSWTPASFLDDANSLITTSTPNGNTIYTLTASTGDCSDTTTSRIILDLVFNMPNAFTPNNDGINDVFYPENLAGGSVREFRIYNQWGQLIYEDPTQGWNGFYGGVLQSPGLYYYYIRITNGNLEEVLSGELYLVL